MRKRVVSLLLAVVMIATLFAGVTAQEGTKVYVNTSDISMKAGEISTIPVVIEHNPGFDSADILIQFDTKALELVAVLDSYSGQDGLMEAGTILENIDNRTVTFMSVKVIKGDGTLFWIQCRPKESIINTDTPISVLLTEDADSLFTSTTLPGTGAVECISDSKHVAITGGLDASEVTPVVTVGGKTDYVYGERATALTANASVANDDYGSAVTYQWYQMDGEEGIEIANATASTYTPALTSFGSEQYYCVATNTLDNGRTFSTTSKPITVTYSKKSLEGMTLKLDLSSPVYNGNKQTVKVSIDGVASEEYTVSGDTAGPNVDTYTVKATAKENGNYTGSTSATWEITPATLTDNNQTTMTVYTNGQEYNLPFTAMSVDGVPVSYAYQVTEGSDLIEVDSSGCVKAKSSAVGNAEILVTATCPNHNDLMRTVSVTVANKEDVSHSITFTAKDVPQSYTGSKIAASTLLNNATVTDESGLNSNRLYYIYNEKTIQSLDNINFLNAGSYTVTAVYQDDTHYGEVSKTVTIGKATINVNDYSWNYSSADTYDGTNNTVALTGIDTDKVQVTYGGTTTAKNAGEYTATASLAPVDSTNYRLTGETTKTLTWSINQKPVTVSDITAEDKVYDGNDTATLDYSGVTIAGKVEGDDLTVSATGTFSDENVGPGKTVTITNITLGGEDKANYTLAASGNQTDATASITAKEVTVSGITAANKEYDGTIEAALDCNNATFAGMVAGDTLTVASATGTFSDKNVGTNKTVTITDITLGGTDASNYTLASDSAATTAAITAKALTGVDVSGVTVTKVYDGTTNAGTVSGTVAFDGEVGTEDVSITATAGAYADKNVGTGKAVTLSLALEGADKDNYSLEQTTASCSSASITACGNFTDATAQTQNVVVGVGTFTEPIFTGIGGETVTGTTTYTYQGTSNQNYEQIVNALKSLSKGDTAAIDYSFTAGGNYTGTKTDTITVTMVDILFTVDGQTATSENAVTVTANPTYGDSWSEIVTINEDAISATLNGESVDGTYSLVNGAEAPDAGSKQYTVQFNDGEKNYTVCTGTVQIAQKPLTITGLGAASKEYDGDTDATVTGTASLSGLLSGDQVSITTGSAAFESKNVGLQTVNFSGYGIEGTDAANYTVSQPASVQAEISRKPVTITGVTVADKAYDGTTAATVTNAGTVEDVISGDTVTVVADTALFASADVGENIPVTFSGFTLTGADAGNYQLSAQPASVTAKITKGSYTGTTKTVNIGVLTNQSTAATGRLTATDFFTTLPAGAKIERVTGTANDIMDAVTAAEGTITYTSKTELKTAGQTATYTVTISTKNYEDITATLTFTTVDKTPVDISGVSVANKTYDGKTVSYTGTPVAQTADGETVTVSGFTYTWKDSEGVALASAPKNAGSYTLTVAVAETDSKYTGSVTLNFTIAQATVTITALDASATVGSRLPAFTYRVAGLAEGESLKVEPTLSCNADMNKVGTYPIVASGAEVPDGGNYAAAITYVNGKLSVYYNVPNSVTVYGGSHGVARVSDINADSGERVTITVTPDEGYEVDQVLVTTASGKKVPVTRTGENRYVFEMPDERVSIQVTYKVEEEIVYTDISPYAWYAEAVDYVTEEGLMNGVGEGKFGPNVTVTRAMVWTVLARMDGENTEGGSTWYSKAQTWAMETGVSDGTSPESAITREQLAAMLYRASGSPAVSGSLSGYTDGSAVSDWAEDAMIWAIDEGLIEGMGNNKLAPTADTTRAQLAQILMRFDKKF